MSTELINKISLPALNLPHFEPQLQQVDGKLYIFDFLRKKHLLLTPEEWVRQHWINNLIHHHQYPRGLFSLEKGLKYNKIRKRTDLVVFDRQHNPYLLVECKAPNIAIDQKVLNQIMTYNSTLNCSHLILSNGLVHVYLEYSKEQMNYVQRTSLSECPK
ncbi:type I restriction enzyme HsdR N-terminal domain-containing protein [Algoriphagus litoralis]|uniref:type I restriction enzyme HsdR N-terminal domain-containing protein n=1 Tax=Algoriphagus litoralis TaxID=2202829 RepID=UPI000DBA2883|nr:type I restriction enzyme HsdR N-terminal domain-containing protein [Algoriphagus litoralis]